MSRGDMTTLPPAPEREAHRPRSRRAPAGPAEPAAGSSRVTQLRQAAAARPRGRGGQRPPAPGGQRPPAPAGQRPSAAAVLRPGPGEAGGAPPATRTRRARPSAPARPAVRRPGPGPAARPAGRAGGPEQESRTRFVFLVLGLLGGGLICLLLINTVLATGSLQITALQKANVQIAQQSQDLRARIAAEEAPAALYKRARQLGMAEPPLTHFLDLRKGRIISQPGHVRGVVVYPPGYTP